MKIFDNRAVVKADILLPVEGLDLTRWSVIACDQYTSEPEYWERVAAFVGSAPSTYYLIYPEVYLECPEQRNQNKKYQKQDARISFRRHFQRDGGDNLCGERNCPRLEKGPSVSC